MAKVTDLSQLMSKNSAQASTHPVVLFDKSTIHLIKPTQAMVMELMGLEERIRDPAANNAEIMEILNAVLLRVLNNNREKRAFDQAYILDNFTIEISMALLKDYIGFIEGIQSSPN